MCTRLRAAQLSDPLRSIRRGAWKLSGALLAGLILAPSGGLAQLGSNAEADQAYIARVVDRVLENQRSNVPVAWRHSETGSQGSVTVERTFYLDRETPCRDYVWTLEQADGTEVSGRGTGCRRADGSWELDEEPPVVASRAAPKPAASAPAADPACSCPEPPAAAAKEEKPFAEYTLPAKAGF